jgi:hypothetical protein
VAETLMLLRCEAISWISDDFPGWIKARLVDVDGVEHIFTDKAPIFTDSDLSVATDFPAPVHVRCDLVAEDDGDQVLVVSTARDGLAAEDGRTEFRVRSDQVERQTV